VKHQNKQALNKARKDTHRW